MKVVFVNVRRNHPSNGAFKIWLMLICCSHIKAGAQKYFSLWHWKFTVPHPTTSGHELQYFVVYCSPGKKKLVIGRGYFAGEPVPGDQNIAKMLTCRDCWVKESRGLCPNKTGSWKACSRCRLPSSNTDLKKHCLSLFGRAGAQAAPGNWGTGRVAEGSLETALLMTLPAWEPR